MSEIRVRLLQKQSCSCRISNGDSGQRHLDVTLVWKYASWNIDVNCSWIFWGISHLVQR